VPKSVSFEQIQKLRAFYKDDMTSALLGIHKFALGFKDQPSPAVRRLAYLLHRTTFPTGKPVNLFELLTCGKYDRTPQETGPPDGDWTI
jgi:hypothetical protein